MTAPVRLRMSRAAGFDLQAHSFAINGLPAIVVRRPTKWGNPFVVGRNGDRAYCVYLHRMMLDGCFALTSAPPLDLQETARNIFLDHWRALSGHNLACTCSLDGPCHADNLLEAVAVMEARHA